MPIKKAFIALASLALAGCASTPEPPPPPSVPQAFDAMERPAMRPGRVGGTSDVARIRAAENFVLYHTSPARVWIPLSVANGVCREAACNAEVEDGELQHRRRPPPEKARSDDDTATEEDMP